VVFTALRFTGCGSPHSRYAVCCSLSTHGQGGAGRPHPRALMRSPSPWARLWCRSSKGVLDNDMHPPVEGPRHVHSVAGAKLLAMLLVFGCGHRAALGYCVAGKWRRGLARSVCSWGLLPVKTHRGAVSQQHEESGSPHCRRWSPVTSELRPARLAHTRRDGSRACHLVCTWPGR
jgi:hypothetical protein